MKKRPTLKTMATAAVVAVTLMAATAAPLGATSPPHADPLPTGMAGVHGEVTRLYLALLDRKPDGDGLSYWVNARQDDTSLQRIVAHFRHSPEFEARFGAMVDASAGEWVEFMYQQVLGRPSDAGGRDHWVALIESGAASNEDLIAYFSESPEFQISTGTGMVGFLHLVDLSEELYEAEGDSYVYQALGGGYWARELTTIEVRNGVVVRREFQRDFLTTDGIEEEWTETGAEIGTHAGSAAGALTVPEVHDDCRNRLGTLDPIEHQLALFLDDDGRMTSCGGIVLFIADIDDDFARIHNFQVI